MLYAILCYHDEAEVNSWPKEKDDAVLAKRAVVTQKLAAQGKLGPVARLMPTTAATTVRSGREPWIIDGPFAETKELVAGYWLWQVRSMDEALEWLKRAPYDGGTFEVREIFEFEGM